MLSSGRETENWLECVKKLTAMQGSISNVFELIALLLLNNKVWNVSSFLSYVPFYTPWKDQRNRYKKVALGKNGLRNWKLILGEVRFFKHIQSNNYITHNRKDNKIL